MSFLGKMFGGKTPEQGPAAGAGQEAKGDPASDPNLIRVFDGYGREMFITKQQWKDDVLLGNLRKAKTDPEQLHAMLAGALQDGFAADIVPYAEHLWRTDPVPSRGATILGIVYMEVNRLDDAQRVLSQLYAQKRHDWQQTLSFWDTELAKADVAKRVQTAPEQPAFSGMSIEGPLWMRGGSPFAALLPGKHADAQQIAIVGSTALLAHAPEKPEVQLSDRPGRLSRGVPLILAEQIHLLTGAVGVAIIPWAQNQGFALFGAPCGDQTLCDLARQNEKVPAFMTGIILDTTQSMWRLDLCLLRMADGRRVAETQVEAAAGNPGPAVGQLADRLLKILATHAGVRTTPAPAWYQVPSGQDFSDYLLRLEQQLAVASMHVDFLKGGGLSGEHEILDGILQLCVRQPKNPTLRMIFAETLRQMRKVRPEILPEYKEKIALLQREHPLTGNIAQLIEKTIAETLRISGSGATI